MRRRAWWVGCTVLVAACSGGDGKEGASGATGESGTAGLNALIATSAIAAGDDCVAGGYEVRSGQDLNADGSLSTAETRTTDYICNGSDAASSASGGAGPDESSGKDGLTSLVSVTTIAPGDDCAAGGLRLEAGLDSDGSGSLDAAEVTTTRALCNGESGSASDKGDPGLDSLIVTHPVDEGSDDCAAGGTRIDIGQDADRDGTLSEAEITTTSYICHGQNGADGMTGKDGATGMDGAVGKDGVAALVAVGAEPAGEHCAYGGSVITSGLDDGTPGGTAGDGVLDPAEVNAATTTYLCRPEPSLEDLLAPPGQVVSLHLEGDSISADFAVIEHLGSENVVNHVAGKTGGSQNTLGALSYPPVVLHGRMTGKPLDALVAWRAAAESTKVQRVDLTLTATELATDAPIATWNLTNAWPSGLEIKLLKGSSEPEVTLEVVFEDLAASKLPSTTSKNAVHLSASGVDTTCSSIVGIGSDSAVTSVNSGKGIVAQTPNGLTDNFPVCVRPVDGETTLSKWRDLIVDGKATPKTMTISLPEKQGDFEFTAAWPSKTYVDTALDGTLVQTITFAVDDYSQK